MRILWSLFLFAGIAFPRTEFWAPLTPPRVHYIADVKYDPAASRLAGTETIRFRNTTGRPMGRIALRWFGDSLSVEADRLALARISGTPNVALFDLPRDLEPEREITLSIAFSASWKLDAKTESAITSSVVPQLWWGFGTLDDYQVRLAAPDGYVWATSGRLDSATRAYVNEAARTFGAFLGKGYESGEADAGAVRVRAVFTHQGRPCAELLLKTAVDAIGFYRERFGLYPHRSLSIVPGIEPGVAVRRLRLGRPVIGSARQAHRGGRRLSRGAEDARSAQYSPRPIRPGDRQEMGGGAPENSV
jgi:hypothetical protein